MRFRPPSGSPRDAATAKPGSMASFRTGGRFIVQFSRFDAYAQKILLGRQRAGGKGCVGAGRVMSSVEIQYDLAVFRLVGVEKAAGRICLLAAGEIVKVKK